MLTHVQVPVLFTHHFHRIDPLTGALMGAISDLQVARVELRVTAAGQALHLPLISSQPHSMHGHDPKLYADTLTEWHATLTQAA